MKHFIFLLSIIITNTYCMESYGDTSASIPIYFFPGKNSSQAHLNINIPARYKKTEGSSNFFQEFVLLETPNPDNWSERIYTHFVPSSTAQQALLNLRAIILRDCLNVKIKYISIENMIIYTIATTIISYSKSDKNIIVFARYISGINCCSGFQHYINTTNKDLRESIKKLKDFAEYQTELKNWGQKSENDFI